MSLDFPLLVRSRNFCFFSVSAGGKGPCFCYVFAPFPEKGILDFIAHRPIIQVFTVGQPTNSPSEAWGSGEPKGRKRQ